MITTSCIIRKMKRSKQKIKQLGLFNDTEHYYEEGIERERINGNHRLEIGGNIKK